METRPKKFSLEKRVERLEVRFWSVFCLVLIMYLVNGLRVLT